EREIACPVVSRKDHHSRGADEAAVLIQGVEVQRYVAERGGEDAARGAAREIALELMAVLHAAAVFVYQFAHRDAGRCQMHPGFLHAARYRERAQTLAFVAAVSREPL